MVGTSLQECRTCHCHCSRVPGLRRRRSRQAKMAEQQGKSAWPLRYQDFDFRLVLINHGERWKACEYSLCFVGSVASLTKFFRTALLTTMFRLYSQAIRLSKSTTLFSSTSLSTRRIANGRVWNSSRLRCEKPASRLSVVLSSISAPLSSRSRVELHVSRSHGLPWECSDKQVQ